MLPALIETLTHPQAYPHTVAGPVQLIETHISWLLLSGEFAYKIKKPVDFGFLDFTSLAKRQHFCEEELRLNQRLAPDIYDTLIAITGTVTQPHLHPAKQLPPATPVLEYAVRMRRFDPAQRLDRMLQRRDFLPEWIDNLAEQIANFHQRIPRAANSSPWGSPAAVWEVVGDNFQQIRQHALQPDDCTQLQRLAHRTAQDFRALTPLLTKRKQQGFIRECHGDLHLANITLFHNQLRLFDCIEFNLPFRWIDTLCDLAFLLMDLDARGHQRWANRCINRYLEHSGDYQALALLPFYKSYRAMVRAKVALLGVQPDYPEFRRYLQLCAAYHQPHRPVLYLMQGVSGSGKSYLSEQLAEHIGAIRLRSDVERKRLYGQLSPREPALELYGQQMNARTFQHLLTQTEQLLQHRYSVIVDATFIFLRTRQRFVALAQQAGVNLSIIRCQCDEKLLQARLIKRQQQGMDVSDADISIMQQQQTLEQPPQDDELDYTLAVNTDDDEALPRLLQRLVSQQLISAEQICT